MRSMSQCSATFGMGAVRRFAQRRRGDDRQPVVLPPSGAPAEVADLDHRRRAVLVDAVGHRLDPRHDRIVVGMQVAERRRAVGRDDRRACRHRQRQPALGLLHVVQPVAVLGHAVFAVRRFVRRREHPIAQRKMLQGERLEKRV